MTQPSQLSPAAEAILAAVRRYCPCEPAPEIAAAVLLELADQVAPPNFARTQQGKVQRQFRNSIISIHNELLEGRG